MFACIPGLTKNTAKIIIENFGLKNLLENKINKNIIINLKKTPKTNIGKKITNELYRFFIKNQEGD